MIARRQLLVSTGVIGALAMTGQLTAAPATATALRDAARQTYLYTLPLIEMAESRALFLQDAHVRPNQIYHDRELATPRFRSVTTPNNDTMYSRAWLDLTAGPVTVSLPELNGRYMSVAFLDMYSNNFAIIGSRTTGDAAIELTLVAPASPVTEDSVVRAPTPYVWMLVRTGTDGPDDVPSVHKIQDEITLRAAPAPMPPQFAGRSAPWGVYFESAQRLMERNPPPPTDRAVLSVMASLGLTPRGGFRADRFTADQRAQIEAGIADAKVQLEQRGRQGELSNNWAYSKYNIGDYEQDYLYRAQVALGGLGALTREEAIYSRLVGPDGKIYLPGGGTYRMRFAPGELPPVDGFWSMTMYERTSEGQFYLADNAINRYALGSRTGLVPDADGGVSIWLSPSRPADVPEQNWLPIPAARSWSAVMRLYLPQDDLLNGRYRLPGLEKI